MKLPRQAIWRTATWHNMLALLLVGLYLGTALAAPWLAPQADPQNPVLFRRLPSERPSALHKPRPPQPPAPLGTTPGGGDVYFALIWGTRPALRFGLVTALSSACFGVLIGAFSAYIGGKFNRLVMYITNAFLTFPAIAGIYLFSQVLFPPADVAPYALQQVAQFLKLDPVMLALITFSWMPYARLINVNVSTLKQTEYAMAAKVIGVPAPQIVLRHLLPTAITPAIVLVARDVGGMVLLEAAFTFIGIGAGLPWGRLLAASRDWIIGPGGNPFIYWWVFVPATLALIGFSMGWNVLGDRLTGWLNPKGS